MRRPLWLVTLGFILYSLPGNSQTPTPAASPAAREASTNRLPVKKVVLYKNGVGYFEHTTRVRGTQDLNIDFTTAQLNDVLKSLTVLDLGDGRISNVRYNSVAPLAERLRGLRLPLGEETSQQNFLNALRGARLSAQSGARAAVGKLLSVETRKKPGAKGENPAEVTEITLITDGGEIQTFELGPGTTVRIAERDMNEEVGQYLNLLASARAQDLRRMTLTAAGEKDREVFVSYISEVPVWKSTYRLIMPDKPGEKPLLQGWAIVDNTIGEDWKDVHLSLVAGAPQSFVQQISQPYYVRRPVVAMPETMSMTPQTHEAAIAHFQIQPGLVGGAADMVGATANLEGIVTDPSGAVIPGAKVIIRNEFTGAYKEGVTDSSGRYRFENVQAGNSALMVEKQGFKSFSLTNIYLGIGRTNEIQANLEIGTSSQAIEVRANAPTLETSTSSMSMVIPRALRQRPETEGKELGDLFEYDVKDRVTIEKNQSALVPILQSAVTAEKVALWNSSDEQPRRALWVTNTSGLTLDGGTFNVLDGDAFAGEGVIELLHPGERRLISYAADLAVRITVDAESAHPTLRKVKVQKGVMFVTQEDRQTVTYKVNNFDTSPRQVIIEHPTNEEWELVGDLKPEESAETVDRFRVSAEPKKSTKLVVVRRRPVTSRFELSSLDDDETRLLLEATKPSPESLQLVKRVLAQNEVISGFEEQSKTRKNELDSITADQNRLRENMKALKGTAEEKSLLQRYVGQLNSQEDRIAALRTEMEELKQKHDAAQADLDKLLEGMALDVTL